MRMRGLGIAGAVAVMLAAAWPCDGGVATVRLGTGRVASRSASGLPQGWVAPAKAAPVIDGRLDDAAWQTAGPFTLGDLRSAARAEPRTVVRFVHLDRVLYMAVELSEPDVEKIKHAVAKDDGPAYQDDSVELFISPYPARGYFQFIFAAGGAIYDRVGHGQAGGWNAGAKAAVVIGKDRWTLEAAIPMGPMGVGATPPVRWRANVYRNRQVDGSNQAWSPTFRGDYDVPEKFGYLLFTPAAPWAQQEQTAEKQSAIQVTELPDGRAVLRFDLSSIPAGARVHRARLLCERGAIDARDPLALANIEILPLAAEYKEGSEPKADAKPLELAAPWYDAFDMTDLVAAWHARRRANFGLYVKTFPAWRIEKTFLDVMYDGPAADVPPQVTGVAAVHQHGQTFVTWREIDDPVGGDQVAWGQLKSLLETLDVRRQVRYCVYRSRQPLAADSIAAAERIAVVRPLSCWNTNGRNVERPIDHYIATADGLVVGHWDPFGSADADGDFGLDCPIDRLAIADGGPPLARGTGLYVHTAAGTGSFYYAVVTCVDGVENLSQFSAANATSRPVAETPAEPTPVLQGELPRMSMFNFHERRLHFVRWVGPPCCNLPSQYYNWSVGLPDGLATGAPVELSLHRDGRSYWRTQYRIERDSIVLSPHDFPVQTFWYGCPEGLGTLRSLKQGVIQPYTERRLLSFLDWAIGKWSADRARVLVTGCRGGGAGGGALHLGLRYPRVFSLVISGHGEPLYGDDHPAEKEKLWGRIDWGLPTDTGRSVWAEHDMVELVQRTPPTAELPVVALTFNSGSKTCNAFATAMLEAGRPMLGEFSWGGTRYLPVSRTETFPNVIRMDVRADRSLPAFRSGAGLALLAKRQMGEFNTGFRWADVLDTPDRYEATLSSVARGGDKGDVVLRRLQKLGVRAGDTFAWSLRPAGGKDATAQGEVTIGPDGLLVIPQVALAAAPVRLVVVRSR